MRNYWWTYVYDPTEKRVTVLRWTQSGNLRARIDERYDNLTWQEALDVLECDSWSLVQRIYDQL